jgi:hypothetical protein
VNYARWHAYRFRVSSDEVQTRFGSRELNAKSAVRESPRQAIPLRGPPPS